MYHNQLEYAWHYVTEVLFYEETWNVFNEKFPRVKVDIEFTKTFELQTNWSNVSDIELENVKLVISVYDDSGRNLKGDLLLDSLAVHCLDRLNYPEGFNLPDRLSDYQYNSPAGYREISRKDVV